MAFDAEPPATGAMPAASCAGLGAAEIEAGMALGRPGRPDTATLAMLHAVQVEGDFDRGLDRTDFEPCLLTVMLRPIGRR